MTPPKKPEKTESRPPLVERNRSNERGRLLGIKSKPTVQSRSRCFRQTIQKISPAVAVQARIFVKVFKKRKCGRQLRLFGGASKAAPGLPCVRGLCFVCAVRHKRSSAIRAFILPRRADVPAAQAKRAHRKPAFIERVPGKSRMVL